MEYLITFPSSHLSILAEQLLLARNLKPRIMPLPPAIKAGCGLCLRIDQCDLTAATTILDHGGATPQEVYRIQKSDKNPIYIKE